MVVKGKMSFVGCSGTPFVTYRLGGKIKTWSIPPEQENHKPFLPKVSPCNAGAVGGGVFNERRGNVSFEGAWESIWVVQQRTNCGKGAAIEPPAANQQGVGISSCFSQ